MFDNQLTALLNRAENGIEAALSTDETDDWRDDRQQLDLRIELGRTRLQPDDVEQLRSGSVVLLDQRLGEPAAIYAADHWSDEARSSSSTEKSACGLRNFIRRNRLRFRNEPEMTKSKSMRSAIANRLDSFFRRPAELSAEPAPTAESPVASAQAGLRIAEPKSHNSADRADHGKPPSGFGSAATVFGSLALVLGIFFALVWLLRRAAPPGPPCFRPRCSNCWVAPRWRIVSKPTCCVAATNCC